MSKSRIGRQRHSEGAAKIWGKTWKTLGKRLGDERGGSRRMIKKRRTRVLARRRNFKKNSDK